MLPFLNIAPGVACLLLLLSCVNALHHLSARADSRQDRLAEAQRAIDVFTPSFQSYNGEFTSFWYFQSAGVLRAMAMNDFISGENRYATTVRTAIPAAWNYWPHFIYDSLVISQVDWAMASLHGYQAYKDSILLQRAQDTWDNINQFRVPGDGSQAIPSWKNSTILKECSFNGSQPVSTTGGVIDNVKSVTIQDRQAKNDVAEVRATTSYAVLSAYLGYLTGDSKYTKAADENIQFIQNAMMHDVRHIVAYNVSLSNCSREQWAEPWLSGYYIQALSVLWNVTGKADYSQRIIPALNSIIGVPGWYYDNGILKAPGDIAEIHGFLLQSLSEATRFQPGNTDFSTLVKDFTLRQYNALLSTGRGDKADTYKDNLVGEPSVYANAGQISASFILNSVIGFGTTSSSSSASPGPSSTSSASSGSKLNIGVIVGPVVGGVSLILIGIALFFFLRDRIRRRRKEKELPTIDFTVSQPFMSQTGTVPAHEGLSPSSASPGSMTKAPEMHYTIAQPVVPHLPQAAPPSGPHSPTSATGMLQVDRPVSSSHSQTSGHGGGGMSAEETPTEDLVRILADRLREPPRYQE